VHVKAGGAKWTRTIAEIKVATWNGRQGCMVFGKQSGFALSVRHHAITATIITNKARGFQCINKMSEKNRHM
jgi:hypothetical protein